MLHIGARKVQLNRCNTPLSAEPFARLREPPDGIGRKRDEEGQTRVVVAEVFEEAVEAGVLQAYGIDHPRRGFGDARRRVAGAGLGGNGLGEHRSVGNRNAFQRLLAERPRGGDERGFEGDAAKLDGQRGFVDAASDTYESPDRLRKMSAENSNSKKPFTRIHRIRDRPLVPEA
jgi:hypothetical protein